MVAVVTGNGLGINNTSLTQLGSAQGGSASLGQAGTQYVNTVTGNLVLQTADEGLLFDGLPLNVLRTYNSLGQLSGDGGWTFGFSRSVHLTGNVDTAGSTITRTDDDGSMVVYTYNASLNAYVSSGQSGAVDTLSWNASNSTWIWNDPADKQQEIYTSTGVLETLTDTATNANYQFVFNGTQLQTITAGDGDILKFGYDVNNRLSSLSIEETGSTSFQQLVQYGYDTQGRLQTVKTILASDTDQSATGGYFTTYTYDGSSDRVETVTQGDGTNIDYSVTYGYTENAEGVYQVSTIQTGSGSDASTLTMYYGTNYTTITDSQGNVTTYRTNAAGQLISVAAPAINDINPTTQYTYDTNGNLLTMTDANGAVTTYTYDVNGNVLSVEDGDGRTIAYTYNSADQVTSTTTYTVAAQGVTGQTGYVPPNGGQSTYNVYTENGQLAYAVDPLGDVTEYNYGTDNGVNDVLLSVKQYGGATYSLSGLSPNTPPTLAQLQSWVASSPVQTTLDQGTRTDYSYDVRGQVNRKTQYDALDSSGNGVMDTGTIITTTTYDAQGRLLQSAAETGTGLTTAQATSYAYDGMGRLVTRMDAMGNITHYVYLDSSNTITINQASGLTTTQVYNNAGQLISSTQSAAGQTSRETQYLYNADGQLAATIDPDGSTVYTFYDADGRVSGTIGPFAATNPFGGSSGAATTTYSYDQDGNLVETYQYAGAPSIGNWIVDGAISASMPITLPIPAASSQDRVTRTFYNNDGQVVATIDPEGNLTTNIYDGVGNLLSTTQYATAISSNDIAYLSDEAASITPYVISSPTDRTQQIIYDADNRPVASVDPDGYVRLSTYDAMGNLVRETQYATALTAAERASLEASPTLETLDGLVTAIPQDQVTRNYYDAADEMVASFDPEGYLTTYTHDETTDTSTTTLYASELPSAQLESLTGIETVAELVDMLPASTVNQQSSVTYNADGQVSGEVAANGETVAYTYNAAGQVTSKTVTGANNSNLSTTTNTTYDTFGDELTDSDANGAQTTYTYNVLGQEVESLDPNGNAIWFLNTVGGGWSYRIVGESDGTTVNALGAVTAVQNLTLGPSDINGAATYTMPITMSGLATELTQNLTTLTNWAGALQSELAAIGNPGILGPYANVVLYTRAGDNEVTTATDNRTSYGWGYASNYTYDAFGDVTQSLQQVSGAGQAAATSNSDQSLSIYDADGQVVATVSPTGSVTTMTYDNQGHVVSTTAYATRLTGSEIAALGSSPTLSALKNTLTASADDRTTLAIYDADGRHVAQVDADGNVITFNYDAAGNQTGSTAFATPLTTAKLQALESNQTLTELQSLLSATSQDVSTQTIFNAAGQIVASIDGDGNASYNLYDALGRLAATVDAEGNVTGYSYDADRHITQSTQYATPIDTASWISDGQLTENYPSDVPAFTTSSGDRTTSAIYDGDGNLVASIDALGNVTTFTYNSMGNVLSTTQYALPVTTSLGNPPTLSALRQALTASGNDRTTVNVYDTEGHVLATINAAGYVTINQFNLAGYETASTSYANALTASDISTLGNAPTLSAVQHDLTTSNTDETTRYYYDGAGRVVAEIDGDGYLTTMAYDNSADTTTTTRYATALTADQLSTLTGTESVGTLVGFVGTQDANHQTSTTYNAFGEVVSSTDSDGTITQYIYDAMGDLTQTTAAVGTDDARTTKASYDAFGNVASTTDGVGSTTTYTYDADGNRLSATDSAGDTTWYVYDQDDRLTYTIEGMADATGTANAMGNVTETDHDAFGEVSETRAYAEQITAGAAFAPTIASIQSAIADIAVSNDSPSVDQDQLVSFQYDADGNVLEKVDGNGNETTYTYDAFNELQSSSSNTADYASTFDTYDAVGNVIEQDNGGLNFSRSQEWSYDAFGNLSSYTDGNGNITTYTYDGLNQRLTQSLTVSGSTREESTAYDAFGRVVATTDAMGSVTNYSYDDTVHSVTTTNPDGSTTTTYFNPEGQVSSRIDASGNTTTYSYDADGRLTTTTNPDGSTTSNQYDALGNLTQTTDADGNAVTYAYDAAGHILSQSVDPNGLNLVTSYTYDGRGLKISQTDPDGTVTTYANDGNGNISEMIQGAGTDPSDLNITTDYTYNEFNEVISSIATGNVADEWSGSESTYQYDAIGELTSASSDTGHVLQTTYTYDGDGNITSKTDGNGVATYYFYDEANEQIYSVVPSGGSGSFSSEEYVAPGGAIAQTWYNADGQVVASAQYATPISSEDMQSFSQGEMTTEGVGDLVVTSADDRYSYQVYNPSGQLQYAIDANGNVTETDYNASGQVVQTTAYATPISMSSDLVSALQAGAATVLDIQSALGSVGDSVASARTVYTYYDDMGRVALLISSASIDGQTGGLVQQTQYDSDGNIVAQLQYGTLLPSSQMGTSATTASISQYLLGMMGNVHVTHSVYDDAGRQVYSIDAANNVTETKYDGDGRVIWTLEYAYAIATPNSWDVNDVRNAVSDANSDTSKMRGTENVYDGVGNLVQVFTTASSNPIATYTYDARGLKMSYTDANDNTWNYQYDQYGNLIEQTTPTVGVASYSADGVYQGVTQQSIETDYGYDGDGNIAYEIDASNTDNAVTTDFTYNDNDQLIRSLQQDAAAIDPQTGLVEDDSETSTTLTYDAFGDAVVSQDADGNYAYNVYGANGQLAYAIDGDGYVTGYQYDAYGDQTSVTRYANVLDTSSLVNAGVWVPGSALTGAQVTSLLVTSGSDRTIVTTYDAQGNKLSVTQPAITYTNSDGSTATGSPVTQYTYDAYGNVASQSVLVQGAPGNADAVWATTYNYYDALGNQLMTVDPMGYVTTNTYDAFGDVLSTTEWATAIDSSSLVAGGPQPANPPAGNAATTGLDRITNYTYDNNGNKSSEAVLRSYVDDSGHPIVGYVETIYGYDADNHLTTVTQNGNTITTTYDALGRIASVQGPQVEVLVSDWQSLLAADPSLNLENPSLAGAPQDPTNPLYVSAAQIVSYDYDALGNRLVQTETSTASTQSVSTYYQYDNAGHVVAQETPLDGGAPDWTSDQAKFMAYDANGNLTSQWYTLTGNDGTTTTVTTVNTYDANSQQTSSTTWRSGVATPDQASSQTYDAFGDVLSTGDGVVVNSTATFDNAGNKITAIDPKTGELHTYGYNLAGQLVSDTVPLAAVVGGTAQTIYTLDLDGRTIGEQAPSTDAVSGENAGVLQATYDRWGNVLTSQDAAGNTTTYTYNERNDVVTETEAAVTVVGEDGTATTTTPVKTSTYDINGNLIASTDEDGNVTRTAYNALGQVIETTDGTGAVSYTAYDALGNQVAAENGIGHITFNNVDALGRIVQSGDFVLSADGQSQQLVWQQAYVLDQNGDHIISYDGIGSADLQSGDTTDAALHATYDGYDSQGRVIWSQDAAQRAASTDDQHGMRVVDGWTQDPTNADFSQGFYGWTADPGWYDYSNGTGPYGTWAVTFTGSTQHGSGYLVNQDKVPVTPGQVITASAGMEVIGLHGGGAVQIYWYDANGNLLSNPDNTDVVSAGQGAGISTLTATAPPGAAYAAIGVGATNYDIASSLLVAYVQWNYVPPSVITINGSDNGGEVVNLPTGSFTEQPTNQDFEEGDIGWDKGDGWSIHTESNTANGSWVGNLTGNNTSMMVNQDQVPVVAGQRISASVQVALDLAPPGAEASGAVAINWYDADGNLISTSMGNLISDDNQGAWETSTVVADAPPGAVSAALAVYGSANGIGSMGVDAARWNYQYIPSTPTGVVQDTYVYDRDGNLISQTTADNDTETWQYNQYKQAVTHTDLSGAVYNYSYDSNTGALIGENDNWSPTAQGQVVPTYVTGPITTPNSYINTYYANGLIASQTYSDGSAYTYQYDANGNQTQETATTYDGNDQLVETVTDTTYDSHNRVSHVVETNALTDTTTLDETYTYDKAGNRREVAATSDGTTVDAWYTYDGDNRVAISDGSLINGQIDVTDAVDSYALAYDAAGNATSKTTVNAAGDTLLQRSYYDLRNELTRADYAVDVTTDGASLGVEETVTYDADGHALETNQFYALGTTLGSLPGSKVDPEDPNGTDVVVQPPSGASVGGELDTATVDFYDSVGRLAEEQTFGNASGWNGTGSAVPTTTPSPTATTYGNLTLQSEVVYQGPNGSSGYDADGDVVAYQYRDNTGRVDQYQVTYLKKDGYLQATTSGVNISDTPNVQPSTSQSVYDTRGDLVALEQHMEDPYGTVEDTVHVFAYDGNGEIIERRDGTGDGATLNQGSTPTKENQHYVYVDGQQVAHYDDAGTLDVLDEVTAFSSNNDSPDSYVVQAGDTLESIAQTQYGNSNLWYVIAQANDVAGDSDLALGQRLTIPTVTTHANSSTTFAPYDPGSIVGSTSPTLPTIAPPPPAPPGGCSTAEILVIVVTVVATIVTEGATSELLAEEFAGMSAVESGAIAGAAAGAAGSVAGQLTAQAEGLQNGFNWGQVAESAIGGAIGGAGTSELSSTNTFGGSSANGLSGWGNAVEGAVGYAGNDLAAELTGQQEHFSWAGLVAASLSSVASGALGPTNEQSQIGLTTGNYVDDVSARAVGDVVDREVSVALGDQHVPSWVQVGENVAGNAIGQPIGTYLSGLAVNAIKSYEAQKAQARLQSLQDGLIAMSASVNTNLDKQYDNQVEAQFQQKMAQAIAQGSQTLSGQIDEYVDSKLESAVEANSDGNANYGDTSGGESGGNSGYGGGASSQPIATAPTATSVPSASSAPSGGVAPTQGTDSSEQSNIKQLGTITVTASPLDQALSQLGDGPVVLFNNTIDSLFNARHNNSGYYLGGDKNLSVKEVNALTDALIKSGIADSVTHGPATKALLIPSGATQQSAYDAVAADSGKLYQSSDLDPYIPTGTFDSAADGSSTADAASVIDLEPLNMTLVNRFEQNVWTNPDVIYMQNSWQKAGNQFVFSGDPGHLVTERQMAFKNYVGAVAGVRSEMLFSGDLPSHVGVLEEAEYGIAAASLAAGMLLPSVLAAADVAGAEAELTFSKNLPDAPPVNYKVLSVPNTTVDAAAGAGTNSSDYGVAFFGKSNLNYYTVDNATLGASGRSFFFMPLEDSAAVTNASDAARLTGNAPSALDAYMNQGDIYGISFPTDGMSTQLPTAADAGGWPHFLEGGNTAVALPDNGGYLVNPTREFVTPGGNAVPQGSVLFQVGPNGEWIPMRHF